MSAPAGAGRQQQALPPRLIAWEVTRSCMLACKHCRAAAQPRPYAGELTTDECFRLLDNIASFARPIIILTGGEPMLRTDIYEIAAHGSGLGLRVVMAPCGALIDDAAAGKIVESGIRQISISLDGATAASHDAFRGVEGAFDMALRGIEAARRAGLGFQINTTVTRHNLDELAAIRDLSIRLGASAFNPFLLVPTGRGRQLADAEISPEQYEQTLGWLADQQARGDILIRVTCAPHYQRIIRQRGLARAHGQPAAGCMGGKSFAFISHRGVVQPCGFLELDCGDLRKEDFDFRTVWETSEIFGQLRDVTSYHGRCGRCEFATVCGGCRARAYAVTGDYLAEEPFCLYQPRRGARKPAEDRPANGGLEAIDQRILSVIQTDFPTAERPFDVLARRLGVDAEEVLQRISHMRANGVIRRLGAVFDSRGLGYVSTLIAARVPSDRIAEVANAVSRRPQVTHNYRRDHEYNLWFTLTAESVGTLRKIIEDLKRQTGIADFHSLPALGVYKIRVELPVGGRAPAGGMSAPAAAGTPSEAPATLTDDQRRLVRLLQEDLPLVRRPFAELAERLAWPVGRLLAQIDAWRASGVLRRFGAVLNHRRLGFAANGMAVFAVPAERVDEAGRRLAERAEISHCYRRPPLPDFPYTLYAMVHGRSEQQVRALVAALAGDIGLSDFQVLFSTAEYKKTSMRYFVEAAGQDQAEGL